MPSSRNSFAAEAAAPSATKANALPPRRGDADGGELFDGRDSREGEDVHRAVERVLTTWRMSSSRESPGGRGRRRRPPRRPAGVRSCPAGPAGDGENSRPAPLGRARPSRARPLPRPPPALARGRSRRWARRCRGRCPRSSTPRGRQRWRRRSSRPLPPASRRNRSRDPPTRAGRSPPPSRRRERGPRPGRRTRRGVPGWRRARRSWSPTRGRRATRRALRSLGPRRSGDEAGCRADEGSGRGRFFPSGSPRRPSRALGRLDDEHSARR